MSTQQKKSLSLFGLIFVFTIILGMFPVITYAEVPLGNDGWEPINIFDEVDPLEGQGLESIVNNILSFMTTLGVSLVTIFIIYGAITWMTSGGDQTKIKAGTETLKWSVIGLAVILMASGIASAVLETLKVKDNPLEDGKQQGLPGQQQEDATGDLRSDLPQQNQSDPLEDKKDQIALYDNFSPDCDKLPLTANAVDTIKAKCLLELNTLLTQVNGVSVTRGPKNTDGSTSLITNGKIKRVYSQYGAPWSDQQYGSYSSYKQGGCGVHALATSLNALGYTTTPTQLGTLMAKNGIRGPDGTDTTAWGRTIEQNFPGVRATGATLQQAQQALRNGDIVIFAASGAGGNFTSGSGHVITLNGVDPKTKKIGVYDSGSKGPYWQATSDQIARAAAGMEKPFTILKRN